MKRSVFAIKIMKNLRVRPSLYGLFVILLSLSSTLLAQTSAKAGPPVDVGVLNGKAKNLVQPVYPAAAAEKGVAGAVKLKMTIDENGSVISAEVISRDPLLTGAAIVAASKSTFSSYMVNGKARKMTGTLVYNFTAPAVNEEGQSPGLRGWRGQTRGAEHAVAQHVLKIRLLHGLGTNI